jgi:single-strand DNA-binding protein
MQDTNVSVFTGRLTRDPELQTTRSGKSVCALRIAIQRRPGPNGEDRKAAFVDVQTWGVLAENCARYLQTGRHVSISGRLEHEQWEYQGSKRQRNYVVADQVLFLGAAPEQVAGSDEPEPDAAAEPQPELAGAAA